MLYEDWTSSYQFKWTPIITFTRRHLRLLDWFEEHLEPAAFADSPERIGLALVAEDLRLTVTGSSMVLESGLSGLDVERLTPALEGVFEILEPKDVLATRYHSTGAVPLSDVNYFEECAAFGRMTGFGPGENESGFRTMDGSAVVDLESRMFKAQVEWGIVSDDELVRRVRRPGMSRLEGRASGASDRVLRAKPSREAAPVSIFTDQNGFWRSGGSVTSVTDIVNRVTEAREAAKAISESLSGAYVSKTREAN